MNLRQTIADVMHDLGRSDAVAIDRNPFVHALADERRLRQIFTVA